MTSPHTNWQSEREELVSSILEQEKELEQLKQEISASEQVLLDK